MRLYSKEHKELVGTIPESDTPFLVTFDETGHAEVEDEAVGNYLLQLQAAEIAQPAKEPKKPEDMSAAQLKKFANENGIDIGEASKKDELLSVINAALEKKAEEGQVIQGEGGDN